MLRAALGGERPAAGYSMATGDTGDEIPRAHSRHSARCNFISPLAAVSAGFQSYDQRRAQALSRYLEATLNLEWPRSASMLKGLTRAY